MNLDLLNPTLVLAGPFIAVGGLGAFAVWAVNDFPMPKRKKSEPTKTQSPRPAIRARAEIATTAPHVKAIEGEILARPQIEGHR
ncbi:hypothetical protein [Actinoplanes missouriensis]|nr:hypothetical protein [Actinoplanes missouriensis]KOX45250.1 hypothetical protein ADL19_23270 [Streptomyces purpurogeneiscleroticus]